MSSTDSNHMPGKKMRICTINNITVETPSIKSFWFNSEMKVIAGQFVMVWIPGVNEVPMSVSYTGSEKAITVANVGPTTTKLHQLSPGARLGIRGPYGNGFQLSSVKSILAVSGGCGSAPLGPVLDAATAGKKEILFAVGAKTNSELLFKTRAIKLGIDVDISTDDGSEGYHGFVTERVNEILKDRSFELIIGCGPEQMLRKIVELGLKHKIKTQVSLERYMKCGIGICDSCAINGYQVCRDGPVFEGEQLINFKEFGTSRRDACGKLVGI
jgi:dihydroorotate dehydrogenase electron transfer subunit